MTKRIHHTDKRVEELKTMVEPIVDKCKKDTKEGLHVCSRSNGETCSSYAFPSAKWRAGDCPMADEILRTQIEDDTKGKVRVGQQKQSKKKSRRR